jgi:hypothetical protein
MKRSFASLIALVVAGAAMPQAPFTIVRPADGSKVRETVHILFPKNSVPKSGGYVGIFVNNKFINATIPQDNGKFLDYPLDTKALALPDGPTTIEAKLYVNFSEKPTIVDKSSVQVDIANQANIPIPTSGISLRYHFQPGHVWTYDWDSTETISEISESQAKMGGDAASVPVEHFNARVMYETDNSYDNGDALVRVQMEPPLGKDSFLTILANESDPRRVFDYNMYPLYMRLHRTGDEVFGLIPSYWGFDSGSANSFDSGTDVIAPYALPVLPVAPVKLNDSWFTRILLDSQDDVDRARVLEKDSLFDKLPARGEFLGVEWENGYRCAKIKDSFEVGAGAPGIGRQNIKTNAVSVNETYWYAIDKGAVIRFERTEVSDKLLNSAPATGGPGFPGANAAGRAPGFGSFGAPGAPGSSFGPSSGKRDEETITPDKQFGTGILGNKGTGLGAGGQGMGPGQFNGVQPTQDQGELRRVTKTQIFTLVS